MDFSHYKSDRTVQCNEIDYRAVELGFQLLRNHGIV